MRAHLAAVVRLNPPARANPTLPPQIGLNGIQADLLQGVLDRRPGMLRHTPLEHNDALIALRLCRRPGARFVPQLWLAPMCSI